MNGVSCIGVVVVIYGKTCAESITCKALTELLFSRLEVTIFDNSRYSIENAKYCRKQGWFYLTEDRNVGISKAYNCAISSLKRRGNADIVCFFDDDMSISDAYFEELVGEVSANITKGVFVPIVYSNNTLLSPCKINRWFWTKRLKSPADIPRIGRDKLSAINSGMAVSMSVFDNYGYDENIFLDGVDHKFLMDMRSLGTELTILEYSCNHGFSGDETPAFDSALSRFRVFAHDYRYILRTNPLNAWLLILKRATHLSLTYRSIEFFRAALLEGKTSISI